MNIFETLKPYEGRRRHAVSSENNDITVNITKGSNGVADNISFTLRNGCYNLIAKTDHIGFEIAKDEDRIIIVFFPEGTWKLVKMKRMDTSRYFKAKLDDERLALANAMVGNYNLCKDAKTKLYFIQKEVAK